MSDIHKAINAVMAEVGYVKKGGKITASKVNYTYVSESDLIAGLRPALVKHGITITPENIAIADIRIVEKSKGSYIEYLRNTTLVVTYRIACLSGQFILVSAVGTGIDSGDKDTGKAQTAAYKHMLRHTFCIETGDDEPDNDPSDDQNGAHRKRELSAKLKRALAHLAELDDDSAVKFLDDATIKMEKWGLSKDDVLELKKQFLLRETK